jgi:hypothetical protein
MQSQDIDRFAERGGFAREARGRQTVGSKCLYYSVPVKWHGSEPNKGRSGLVRSSPARGNAWCVRGSTRCMDGAGRASSSPGFCCGQGCYGRPAWTKLHRRWLAGLEFDQAVHHILLEGDIVNQRGNGTRDQRAIGALTHFRWRCATPPAAYRFSVYGRKWDQIVLSSANGSAQRSNPRRRSAGLLPQGSGEAP